MSYIQETLVNQLHTRAVMTQMQQLQSEQILCDLTLLTKDGGNFPVHKLVMISGSEYFKMLLGKGMLNAEGLIMHDITGNSLQLIINYLYTGVAYVNKFTIMQLYTAASQLSIMSLKKLCRDYVRRNAKSMGLADDLLEEMKTVWAREDAMAKQNQEAPTSMVTSPIGGNTGLPGPVNPVPPTVTVTSTLTENIAALFSEKNFPSTEDIEVQPVDVSSLVQKTDAVKAADAQPAPEVEEDVSPLGRRKAAKSARAATQNILASEDLSDVKLKVDKTVVKQEVIYEEDDDLDYGGFDSQTEEYDSDEDYAPGRGGAKKRGKSTPAVKTPSKRKRGRPKSAKVRATPTSAKKPKAPMKTRSRKKKGPVTQPVKIKIRKVDITEYNKYICSVCGDGFEYDTLLKLHKSKEHASTVPTIGLEFFMTKYSNIRTNPKPVDGVYSCVDCDENFFNLARYKCHRLKFHPKDYQPISLLPKMKFTEKPRRKYCCQLCQPARYFLHLALLRNHNKEAHKKVIADVEAKHLNKRLLAEKKESKLKSKKRLVMTLPLPAHGNIMCQLCKLQIPNQVELASHLQQDHDVYTLAYNKNKIKLQCPDCRKACAGNRNTYKLLRKHIRTSHGIDISKQCFYCGRVMNSRTSLNHHLKSSHKIHPSIMKIDPIMKKYIVGGQRRGAEDDSSILRCHYCRQALPTAKELAEHLRTMHSQFASYGEVMNKEGVKNFDCRRCHRVFKNITDLQVHFVEDHGPGRRNKNRVGVGEVLGIFRCREDGCFYETKEEGLIKTHMKEGHADVKYDCPKCSYSTQLCYQLDEHLPKHRSKFICDLCGKECRKNHALKIHKFRKHDIDDPSLQFHKCDFKGCNFQCFQKSSLKCHMIKHQKDKPYTCGQCGRSLKTAQSLELHTNKVHKGIRPFICEICGRGFSKQCEIRAHIKMHSSDKLKCDHCKFSTMNKYSLISHLLSRHNIQVRENEKLYHCPMCEYKTMREKHLTNHINSHLNVRDFVCSKCGKSFVSANSLRGHNNWVHSEKRYRCDFCSYRGGSLSNLKQHVRIMHTQRGLKPYKCAYCDFRCELSGNCRVHCRSAHKGLDIKWVKVVDFNLDLPKKGLLDDDMEHVDDLPTMAPSTSTMQLHLVPPPLPSTPPPVPPTVQMHGSNLKKDAQLTHEMAPETHEIQDLRDMTVHQENREMDIGRQSAPPSTSPAQPQQMIMYQQEATGGPPMFPDPHATLYLSEPIPTTRPPYYPTDGNLYDVHRAQMYMPHDAHTGHLYQHHEGGGMYTN